MQGRDHVEALATFRPWERQPVYYTHLQRSLCRADADQLSIDELAKVKAEIKVYFCCQPRRIIHNIVRCSLV